MHILDEAPFKDILEKHLKKHSPNFPLQNFNKNLEIYDDLLSTFRDYFLPFYIGTYSDNDGTVFHEVVVFYYNSFYGDFAYELLDIYHDSKTNEYEGRSIYFSENINKRFNLEKAINEIKKDPEYIILKTRITNSFVEKKKLLEFIETLNDPYFEMDKYYENCFVHNGLWLKSSPVIQTPELSISRCIFFENDSFTPYYHLVINQTGDWEDVFHYSPSIVDLLLSNFNIDRIDIDSRGRLCLDSNPLLNLDIVELMGLTPYEPFLENRITTKSTPVPIFGNYVNAKTATLGLNPSNKEFRDNNKSLLVGSNQRLETISNLGKSKYSEVDWHDLEKIDKGIRDYFTGGKSYNWFNSFENYILPKVDSSYFDGSCVHLDIFPWATDYKWPKFIDSLSESEKSTVFKICKINLRVLLQNLHLDTILVNGSRALGLLTNLGIFCDLNEVESILAKNTFSRNSTVTVKKHEAKTFEGKAIILISWNVNLQSSPGVSNALKEEIGKICSHLKKTIRKVA